jgi:thiol-disulfide isomerase/thioredoxin
MLSVSLGPLAFPLPPLLLLASLLLAAYLARRLAPAEHAAANETSVWLAAGLGLAAARAAHVLRHAEAYTATPWSMLDVRDGGWATGPGMVVAAVVLLARTDRLSRTAAHQTATAAPDRWTQARQAMVVAVGSGLVLWAGLNAVVNWASPPTDVRTLTAVNLRPLQPPGTTAGAGESGGGSAGTGEDATRTLQTLLDGRPMVVNLWATWCGPCRAEMPTLAEAQRARPDVRFIFANQGEVPAVVHRYLASQGLQLHDVWLDIGSALGPTLGSSGLPTTVFFSADGRQVDAHFGLLNAAALQAKLARWPAPAPAR